VKKDVQVNLILTTCWFRKKRSRPEAASTEGVCKIAALPYFLL